METPRDTVGPYRVLRRLGRGGMGEVFLAEDPRLRRQVALKTVTAAHAARPEAKERLLREARAAAGLNHPNIAAIYDVLDSDAGTHIVMEYVEGTPLDEVVRRGPLPLRRVLQFGLELCDALEAAHGRGVIHRDLKPGNVRLTASGHVKVLDFGLARTLDTDQEARVDPDGSTAALTEAHQLVGTPAYMAPEQLRGARGDRQSDIYSLGVVLFELLTGHRPFDAPTTLELAVQALTAPVPDVRTLRPDCPADLAAVVARAVARDPRDRLASVQELKLLLQQVYAEQPPVSPASPTSPLSPLPLPLPTPLQPPARPPSSVWQRLHHGVGTRTLVAGAALLAVLSMALGAWLWSRRAAPPGTVRPSAVVAVLPVEAPADAADLGTAAAGIGEILAANLAAVPGLEVVPRSDTVAALGDARDVAGVLRDLAPAFVVKAAVRGPVSRLRLDVNLLDARGGVAWARTYDARGDNPFALPAQVSADVGRAMTEAGVISAQALAATSYRFDEPPTTDRDAWGNYSDAVRFLDRPDIEGSVMRAVTLLEEAVKKDPQFALAWAALGTACAMQYQESLDERWPPRVQQANLEALRLEPDRAETRIALAQMYETTGKYDQAIDELTRAIALAPGSDTPHRLLGGLYTDLGRHDEAVRELRTAIELRPGFWRNWSYLGYAYFQAGRHEEAIPVYQRLVELQPDSARGHSAFGTVLHEMGRTAEARVHYERALSLEPTAPAWSNLGTLDFFDGRAAQAAKAYEEAVRLRPNDPTYHRNLGDAYAAMGRKADAAQAYATARDLLRAQLDTNPRDADALSTLSLIEAKLGHMDEARRLAGDALAQLPDQKDVLYHSAVVATLDARLDEAADLLTRALARGSSARHAAHDPDLAPLRRRDDVRRLLVQRDEASRRQP